MELVDIVALAAIASGIAAALGIISTAIKSNKEFKVSSATLIMKFLDMLREDKFKELWRKITDTTIKEYDSKVLSPYLNTFEEIAVFTKEKTLNINHVREFYAPHLKKIRNDEFIQEYIKQKSDESEGFAFSKLKWLYGKVEPDESKYWVVRKLKYLIS